MSGTLTPEFLQVLCDKLALPNLPRILLETGTCTGESIAQLQSRFQIIHTIELDSALHARAAERFRQYPNVTCHLGDSTAVMAELLPQLQEPVFFYLDAHYCGGLTARGLEQLPVLRELDLIRKREHKDVVLLDDVGYFGKQAALDLTAYPPYGLLDLDWSAVTVDKVIALWRRSGPGAGWQDFDDRLALYYRP